MPRRREGARHRPRKRTELGAIGKPAKKATPTIRKNALGAGDESVRKAAQDALEKLEQ
ncbi:MAG: hypothetical protein R6V58_13600 [Planctomycetota bacterium]